MIWFGTKWEPLLAILSFVATMVGLIASIAAFKQSEEAARSADQAERRSNAAVVQARETAALVRQDLLEKTILSYLLTAQSLGSEIETLMSLKVYPAALVRCRDLGKQLAYLIKRWDSKVPLTTLAGLVDANAKIEQMVDKLQGAATISQTEHGKLLRIVQRVSNALADEHALAEKRKEENG